MKKTLAFIILFLSLIPSTCHASDVVDVSGLEMALPDEAAQYVDIAPDSGDFKSGIGGIFRGFLELMHRGFRSSFAEGFIILTVGALAGMISLFAAPTDSAMLKKAVDITAICLVTLLCLSGASGVLESCSASINRLQYFSSALVPVYAVAVSLTGNPKAAISTASATLLFSNGLIFLASKILIPVIYLHILMSAIGRIAENKLIMSLAAMFRKGAVGFFKYFLMLYTGYITMSGLISAGADAVTLKTAKVTISGSVPVLGSVISDVSEAILSGSVILKNAVGIYGFIGALAVCLAPFVAAAARLIVFKLLSLVSSSLSTGSLAGLLDSISDSYSMALGLLGTCCAIQFLSFVICSVVIKT